MCTSYCHTMESVAKVVVLLLSVSTSVVAAGVDPNAFECTSKSPTSPPVYSNTNPPVALTHIFCGEINKNKKAVGFHSRHLSNMNSKPGGTNYPPCAKATGKITCDSTKLCQKCPFSAEGIEVLLDKKTETYIKKTTNQGNPNKFFPDSWKPQFIVDLAIKIFKACMNGVMPENVSKIACLRNYKITDHDCSASVFNIKIFTDGVHKAIATIFPTSVNDLKMCDYTCSLPEDVDHSEL